MIRKISENKHVYISDQYTKIDSTVLGYSWVTEPYIDINWIGKYICISSFIRGTRIGLKENCYTIITKEGREEFANADLRTASLKNRPNPDFPAFWFDHCSIKGEDIDECVDNLKSRLYSSEELEKMMREYPDSYYEVNEEYKEYLSLQSTKENKDKVIFYVDKESKIYLAIKKRLLRDIIKEMREFERYAIANDVMFFWS
jgi:hypothetical protein